VGPCEFCEAEDAERRLTPGLTPGFTLGAVAFDETREDVDATRFANLGASRTDSVDVGRTVCI